MNSRSSFVALLVSTAALPGAFALAAGNPSATGQASLTVYGGLQTYAFAAVQHGDGRVTGQFTLDSRGQDVVIHGQVACLEIVGNEAFIGGTITSVGGSSDPGWDYLVGRLFAFRVQDNGSGRGADLVSDVTVNSDCNDAPFLSLLPSEAGNISVNP